MPIIRRIYQSGGSNVISIPSHLLGHLGIELGQEVQIWTNSDHTLTIVAAARTDFPPSPSAPTPARY